MTALTTVTTAQGLLAKLLTPITRPIALAKVILAQPPKEFAVVDFLKGLSVLAVILFHVFFAVFFVFKKDIDKLNHFIADIPTALIFYWAATKRSMFFLCSAPFYWAPPC
ncbi:hypothetical protein [Thiomicrorhabdus aquaedulcis]|uniref:hypothetical protein n=1 Tax=Thiomicrorhabdus aquaedulcis TaxID=2211106 RepID=UPI000FDC0B61|nr:hypothetical protein [Thiomicrorhabdus aquaedulcis]